MTKSVCTVFRDDKPTKEIEVEDSSLVLKIPIPGPGGFGEEIFRRVGGTNNFVPGDWTAKQILSALSYQSPRDRIFVDSLRSFMEVYVQAAESGAGVPAEIYELAPLAARYLVRVGATDHPTIKAIGADAPKAEG